MHACASRPVYSTRVRCSSSYLARRLSLRLRADGHSRLPTRCVTTLGEALRVRLPHNSAELTGQEGGRTAGMLHAHAAAGHLSSCTLHATLMPYGERRMQAWGLPEAARGGSRAHLVDIRHAAPPMRKSTFDGRKASSLPV